MEVSAFHFVAAIISGGVTYLLYWAWFVPMNRIRSLHEVGYNYLMSNETKKVRLHKIWIPDALYILTDLYIAFE